MVYRTSQQEIDDYYSRVGINQTALKFILSKGLQTFIANQDELIHGQEEDPSGVSLEEKEHFIIGKAVDMCLTQGEEVYAEKYYYDGLTKKPSEKLMQVVKRIYSLVKEEGIFESIALNNVANHIIEQACNDVDFQRTWTMPVKLVKIRLDPICETYFQSLVKAGTKQVLSEAQNDKINNVVMSLRTHKFTQEYVNESQIPNTDDIYQFPCYWEEISVDCKALLDKFRVYHNTKEIIPFDFKTTMYSILGFNRVVRDRRYDIQGSWYTQGLKKCLKDISRLVGRDVSDYTVRNFAFIAESTTFTGTPLIFPLSTALMSVGEIGNKGSKASHERPLGGWRDALLIYYEGLRNNFNLNSILSKTNGIAQIGLDFEYAQPII